jgi:hypothetical protein
LISGEIDGRRDRPSTPGPKYIEDPTVAQTAAVEYDRLWQRIGTKVQNGVWFFQAREQVLAEEIPDIAKAYGRPVATRVERAIQCTTQAKLPRLARQAQDDWVRSACRAHVMRTHGKVSWINRLSLRLLGVHFW